MSGLGFSGALDRVSEPGLWLGAGMEEPGGTKSGLSLEAEEGEVIPDKMISSATFLLKTGLSNPDLRSNQFSQPPYHGKAVPLNLWGARNGGDPVA